MGIIVKSDDVKLVLPPWVRPLGAQKCIQILGSTSPIF
jgi:hypothetical protein